MSTGYLKRTTYNNKKYVQFAIEGKDNKHDEVEMVSNEIPFNVKLFGFTNTKDYINKINNDEIKKKI